MERLLHKVKETINKYNMIEKGDRILVAVSGGPDSVTLLHVLNMLKDELNISLVIAHVNHMLRDKEADEDEKYVSNLCDELKIKCYIKRIDIKNISEKEEKKIKNLCSFDFTILMRYREKPLSIFYLYFIRDCLIKKQISKIVRYLFFFIIYKSLLQLNLYFQPNIHVCKLVNTSSYRHLV